MSNPKLTREAEFAMATVLIQIPKMSREQLETFAADRVRQIYYQQASFADLVMKWGKSEALSLPLDPTRLQPNE